MSLRTTFFAIAPAVVVGALVLLAATLVTVRSTSAQSTTTPTCSTGAAVPDADNNLGLVSDCEALQASRDTQTLAAPTVLPGVNNEESSPDGLFYEEEGDPPPSIGVDTLDSRLVGIDLGQLDQVVESPVGPKNPVTGEPQTPNKLILNLFDDVVFTGIVEHVEPTASGHALWGSLEGVELGTMTLVVNGRIVVGTVRTLDGVYTIRTTGDGTYVIREIDESSLPPPGEPLEPTLPPRDVTAETDDVPPDDGSVIDVMVVYTPLVRRQQGGRAAIEALIDLLVAESNQAYENSGVIHRIRLVLREEVEYVEDGDSSIDLHRLADYTDEYMDHIHMLRDLYAADLVHILVGRGDVGGTAQRGGEFGLTASFVGLTFTHELGHNMGLRHDRYASGVPRTGFRYGYVNQLAFEPDAPEAARWRTIMAYNGQCAYVGGFHCLRIPYFSNPDKTYDGDPMGVPFDHPSTGADGPADAVRGLNGRREITANFRPSSTSPTPRLALALSPYWLTEKGGTSTVTATLHRPSSEDTTVTVSASLDHAVILSANRTLTIPAGKTVSEGVVTLSGIDNGDQTGDVMVTVSATATNTSSLGVTAPEPVELAVADDETTPVVTLVLSPAEIVEGGDASIITGTLDNRSIAETTVTVSVSSAEAVEINGTNPVIIPAGQKEINTILLLHAPDDSVFTESKKGVTVTGTATNPQGVVEPESVTLTIIDDDGPYFADDSISYKCTEGFPGVRYLPTADYGDGVLTYSMSPNPISGVSFDAGPPARIRVAGNTVVADETSYTLIATDADGDIGTMTINITTSERVCPNSASVARYTDTGIIDDCEVLLASRDILRGDKSLNWSEHLTIDSWQGVGIVDNRVTTIDLSYLGLTGAIPADFTNLAYLQRLDLTGNQLTGPIPSELGSLAKLQRLSLLGNQLTGPIPPELSSLTNLQWLNLGSNELNGQIPPELASLAELQFLNVSYNQLSNYLKILTHKCIERFRG